jgi:hypothetical protein
MYPRRETCALDLAQGGIGLLAIQEQLQALLGKVVGRLMEPEQLPWKAFFDDSLACAGAPHHTWRLGGHLISSTMPLGGTGLPPRTRAYISAYRALAPHRLVDPVLMPHAAIIFFLGF